MQRHLWLANDVVMPVIVVLAPSSLTGTHGCACGLHVNPKPDKPELEIAELEID